MNPVPFKDESDGRGKFKRTYWPRGDAEDKRRAMRKQLEAELAAKGKNYSASDRQKALNDRWGEYCDTRRSLDEMQSNERPR